MLFIRLNYHQSLHRTHLAHPTGWQSSEWSDLDHTPSNTRPDHDFRFATYAAALQHSAGRGRSGLLVWALGGGGQGIGPSAVGGEIVLHVWSVCTRGPRG